MVSVPHLATILHVLCIASVTSWRDDCQTLSTQVDIVKNIMADVHGETLSVSCVARVTVNKCEGICESIAQPSVREFRGIKKTCRCCREGHLEDKRVILQECYDEDGTLIPELHPVTTIKHIQDCDCTTCTN